MELGIFLTFTRLNLRTGPTRTPTVYDSCNAHVFSHKATEKMNSAEVSIQHHLMAFYLSFSTKLTQHVHLKSTHLERIVDYL